MLRRTGFSALGLPLLAALVFTKPTVGTAAPLRTASHPRLPAASAQVHTGNFGWSSSNWSGYAVTGGSGAFSSITGQWTVASASATKKSSFSSSWIGIDGFNNSNLIQTGTESDFYSGRAHYDAWWEILPASETVISSIVVRPGDVMSASVKLSSGSTWTITITDQTTGASFTTSQQYSGPRTSAEWIEEAPTVGGRVATLAHYGKVTFDPGTVNGANPHLTASESGIMVQGSAQVSTPSAPDSDTDGFNSAYGSTQPSPPTS